MYVYVDVGFCDIPSDLSTVHVTAKIATIFSKVFIFSGVIVVVSRFIFDLFCSQHCDFISNGKRI